MCGAWWCCGCAAVESTWCWLVMTKNDKNASCFGGSRVEGVFRRSSDISPMKVAGGNGGTEQW